MKHLHHTIVVWVSLIAVFLAGAFLYISCQLMVAQVGQISDEIPGELTKVTNPVNPDTSKDYTITNVDEDTNLYINYKYGFSFEYPKDTRLEQVNFEQIYLYKKDKTLSTFFDMTIQPYDDAPDKTHYIYSKKDLLKIKKEIADNPDLMIGSIPAVSDEYYPNGYVKKINFFIDNNYFDVNLTFDILNQLGTSTDQSVIENNIKKIQLEQLDEYGRMYLSIFNATVSSVKKLIFNI